MYVYNIRMYIFTNENKLTRLSLQNSIFKKKIRLLKENNNNVKMNNDSNSKDLNIDI